MQILSCIASFIILLNIFISEVQSDDFKVELVQVLFRHGDRVPTKDEIYKADPYQSVYKKYGYGKLTKNGMRRAFKIGQILREQYDTFLGEHDSDQVYAYSTDSDRTKMSLQLVLAGLYRPSNTTSCDDDILWIPFPTHSKPMDFDFLMTSDACSRYRKLLLEAENSPEILNEIERYQAFYELVKNKTELNLTRPFSMYLIFNNIHCALSMGLSLPEWCSKENLKILEDIQSISYDVMVHTDTLTRMMVGPTIDQFLQNVKNNEDNNNKIKIYLYGAHDINVATFLRAHNFTGIPQNPDFGSTVIFEKLRGKDNKVYIRMALWTGVSEKLIPLKLDNCAKECPLEEYINLIQSILPNDEVKQCTAYDKFCNKSAKI